MFIKTMITGLIFFCSTPIWSFNCYITLAKDSCWTNYNVTVDVIDVASSTVLTTVKIPSGTSWAREKFVCRPLQKLIYQAQFTPVFWEGDEGKTYSAERFWFMPSTINPGDTAWTIPVCFPKAFAQVPFPPDAKTANCACDFTNIPEVKPE